MLRARAPGRVNLIGDHTDYQEGFCLPIAVDRWCSVEARPAEGDTLRAVSAELDGTVAIPLTGVDPSTVEPAWGGFVAGALAAIADRGGRVPAVDLAITSTVPTGSGLSSSAALSVALVLVLARLAAIELDRRAAAIAAREAEVAATGVPVGLLDQTASLAGRARHGLLLDCRTLDVEPVPLPEALAVLVVHSGLPRSLAASEYAQRRAACEAAAARLGVTTLRDARPDQVADDALARHVVSENARVLAFAAALRAGDLDALGPLMLQSHASLRDDFAVSTPELDALVEELMTAGARGARLTGAGFGGCVAALADRDRADTIIERVAGTFRVEAVDGAVLETVGEG